MGEIRCLPTKLLLAILTAVLFGRHYLRWRRHLDHFQKCSPTAPVLIGTHHKTGTVLLKHIFKDVCPLLGWNCTFDNVPYPCSSAEQARAAGLQLCFLQHGVRFKLGSAQPGGAGRAAAPSPYRFVHAIRDPIEVVLSGYKYHLTTTERWALRPDKRYNGSSYRQYLNRLSRADGLRAEVKHSMRDALKTMPRLLNRTSGSGCTMTVRLEDFEADWDGTISKLWDLLGVVDSRMGAVLNEAVAKHNVYAKRKTGYNKHVSSKEGRGAMREQLRAMPDAFGQVQRVRERLGYAT